MKQKKSFWISLFVAGACILAGLACIYVGHILGGHKNMTLIDDRNMITVNHDAEGDFDRIRIDVIAANVELIPSEDEKCHVITKDSEYVEYTVYVVEDTLMIRATDTRAWYERLFTGSVSDRSVEVALPREEYKSLDVKTVSGRVNVNVRYTFSEDVTLTSTSGTIGTAAAISGHLEMYATSGNLYARGFLNTVTARCVSGKISLGGKTVDGDCTVASADLETTSGSIVVTKATLQSLTAQTGSGSVIFEDLAVNEAISAETTSGSIRMNRVTCDSLNAETTSGRIKLTDTVASGHIRAKTGSGAIRLERADAASLSLRTTSGSVTGSLATPKVFYTDTTSGSVDVPKSTEGGLCEIKTTSGSIRLTIEAE